MDGVNEPTDIELMEMLAGEPGFKLFPLKCQLDVLGFNEETVSRLRGERVLDVACGDGRLVEYLRQRGVEAGGMDARAPDAEHYIRRNITGIHPMSGSIPRPDEHYRLVVCHSALPNFVFNHKNDGSSSPFTEENMRAQFMMLESLRVLRNGGRFVTSPGFSNLDALKYAVGEGYRFEREEFGEELRASSERVNRRNGEMGLPEIPDFRTVIYKEK